MQEASFTGVLNTIFIIIMVYYGVKFVGRFLMPIFFQKLMKNFESKVREQQGYQNTQNNSREGETIIEKKTIAIKRIQ